MWPAKPRISQMRPTSQFEFETPALDAFICKIVCSVNDIVDENASNYPRESLKFKSKECSGKSLDN